MYFEEYTSMTGVQKLLFAVSTLVTVSGIGWVSGLMVGWSDVWLCE
jgi:hypothetical protein